MLFAGPLDRGPLWVNRVILDPFAGCLLIRRQRRKSRRSGTAASGHRANHSINSSARPNSDGGTVRPSILADD